MMDEIKYVSDAFARCFSSYKKKKLVLYGLGNNTKMLLDKFSDYSIVGLMDGVRTGEVIWGLPVITCEEAKQMGVEAIVIIARAANVPIIYHRIARQCDESSIPVFDINGERMCLCEREHAIADKTVHEKKEDLYRKIDKCQIISFDIFDTILMRKVLIPTDIFVLVERKLKEKACEFPFSQERRKAELELLNEGKNPELKDIYERLMSRFPCYESRQNEWMTLEIETEKENLTVRDGMKEAILYSRKQKKKIFFTSDMYLPAGTLLELLNYAGIDAELCEVIVSCEYGFSKNSGLHSILRNRFPQEKILHIGDNIEADGQCAKDTGIDEIFLVDSAYTLLGKSEGGELLKFSDGWENRMVMGEFVAKQFRDPFVFEKTKGKISIDTEYDIGYYFLAPILTIFIKWIIDKTEQHKITRLLLASRDGYIIKELLDIVHRTRPYLLPEYVYFYTSRSVCVRAAVMEEEDIRYAAEGIPFSGTAEDLLRQRFGLEPGELMPRNLDESDMEYILRHKKMVLRHSWETRCRYEKYLSKLEIRNTDCCGFFDFVSGGTCQYALSKFWNVELKGLYFLKFYDPVKETLFIDALFQEPNIYAKTSAVEEKYFLLERVLTSFEPTLVDFSGEGEPIFGEETRTQEELDSLGNIQKGIVDGFKRYYVVDKDMADEFIRFLSRDFTVCSLPFLKSIHMTDEFCNRDFEIPGF